MNSRAKALRPGKMSGERSLVTLHAIALLAFVVIIALSAFVQHSDGAPALNQLGKHRSSRDRGKWFAKRGPCVRLNLN
jgi:sugar phosphate permease